jgi:hypothetical protein
MDAALFARRALGQEQPPRTAVGARRQPAKGAAGGTGVGGNATTTPENARKFEPTPEDRIEFMKLLRDTERELSEGPPPDVPESIEVRHRERAPLTIFLP